MPDDATPQLTLPRFQAALQTRFRIQSQADPHIELVLVEARALGSAPGSDDGGSFSILFHGPARPLLPQRTYPFAHDALGTFDLFIVPVGRDRDGYLYEAVFNRQTSPR
jgi:hypothetical protein